MQLVVLNSVVCGLEFCASAAFTYIPPMLLKAGIMEAHMSIVLGVGPLMGFFLVPIIGRMSDNCTSQYGRRRPFILGLGLLLIFSLLIIPYGEYFSRYAFGTTDKQKSKTFGIILLISGAVLLDFTSQACLTPCEALLSDACRNTNQQEKCFTMYSFMVSLGGCIGYLITALDWTSSRVGLYFGGQEQSAFAVLIVLFTLTLCATLGVAEETPLKASPPLSAENESLILNNEIHQALLQQKNNGTLTAVPLGANDAGYETGSNQSLSDEYAPLAVKSNAVQIHKTDSAVCAKCYKCHQYKIPCTQWSITTTDTFFHFVCLRVKALVPQSLKSLFDVPFVLKKLALANYCSWTAIMAFNLFFTDYVGQAVYRGNPHSDDERLRNLYDEGVRMGSWGLLCHCIVAAIYAGFVERLVVRYGMRTMYLMGMVSFTIALGIMMLSRNIYFVNFMAACTGFGYATVTTIPFMLITAYHEHKEVRFRILQGSHGFIKNRTLRRP